MSPGQKTFGILIAGMLSALPLPAAGPEVTIKYEYYDVKGNTAGELKEGMKAYGVRWNDGKRYDAFTGWYVEWEYVFNSVENLCVIERAHTKVSVTYFLPRWKDSDGADPGLQEHWDRFINSLRRHEEGHKEIAVAAALEIEKAVASLNSYKGCEALRNVADTTAQGIIQKYIAQQEAYDKRTGHGRTQGAVFP